MLGDDTTASDDGGPDFAWNAIGSIERDSWEAAAFAAAPAFAAQLANVKRIVVASGKTHAWKIRQLLALVGEIPAPDDDEPKAAPGRECNALEEIARAVQGCTDAGIPHDYEWILEQALDGLGWLPDEWERRKPEPKPAPELAAAMRETRLITERVTAVAQGLETRARINHPSKVSQICTDIAASLRHALR